MDTETEIMRSMLDEMNYERNLSLRVKQVSYSNPVSVYMNLDEGLIRTYPIGTAIRYIKDYFNLKDDEIREVSGEQGINRIVVTMYDDKRNHKLMDRAMGLCGYFPSFYDRKYDGTVSVQYEAKFDNDVTEEIRRKFESIVHATPEYNLGKIRRIGLVPKSKNELFNFPDRIYFLAGAPVGDALDLIKMLCNVNSSKGNEGRYALLKIDVGAVPENVRFYKDQNYAYGIYATQNIPPACIVGEMVYDVKADKIIR